MISRQAQSSLAQRPTVSSAHLSLLRSVSESSRYHLTLPCLSFRSRSDHLDVIGETDMCAFLFSPLKHQTSDSGSDLSDPLAWNRTHPHHHSSSTPHTSDVTIGLSSRSQRKLGLDAPDGAGARCLSRRHARLTPMC